MTVSQLGHNTKVCRNWDSVKAVTLREWPCFGPESQRIEGIGPLLA